MNETTMILLSILPSLGAIIGVYVNLTSEVTRVKSRVISLESDRDELKSMIKECVVGIQELKILLAKKGI